MRSHRTLAALLLLAAVLAALPQWSMMPAYAEITPPPGGGPPSGAAGGALSGTYPSPPLAAAQPDAHTWVAPQAISNATLSTSPSTGGAIVTGGLGVGGAIFSGGGGMGSFNPYTAVFPPGLNYYSTNSAAKTSYFSNGGPIIVDNPLAYGDLDTSVAASFALNSNRPGCSTGYTAPSQIGTLGQLGGVALCATADTVPSLFSAAGTFTATTFVPTSNMTSVNAVWPFGSTATVTQQSLLQVGMWLQTNDSLPFYGQITNVGTGTFVTVSNWYQVGSSTPGTPSGTAIWANPLVQLWSFLPEIYLNKLCSGNPCLAPTGTPTSGSSTIASVSTTVGIIPGQPVSGTGIPANTVTALPITANAFNISQPASATPGSVTLTIAASPGNAGVNAEADVANAGPAFVTLGVQTVTGCSATSGSNTLTGCSAIPAAVRYGHLIYGSSPTIPAGSAVVSVPSSTSVVINQKATATAGSLTLTFFDAVNEGGIGYDMGSVVNNAQAAYSERGNFNVGFLSHGAGLTSYLVRPDGLAGIPAHGFLVDCSIAGCPSTDAFAVTNGGSTPFSVTGTGVLTAQNVNSSLLSTLSTLNVPNGGSVPFTSGYAAQMHATTNANLLVGAAAFLGGGYTGVALLAENDAVNTVQPLVLAGSHIDIDGPLNLRDTSAAFDVSLVATSSTALTASRILTLDMKNAAHTLAFGATANTITFPSTASYTLIGSGDTGTVTPTMIAASTLATGTSVSLTAPREYYVCTGACTVTLPPPSAGYEFCVMNDDNVATGITLAALGSSARYEATARTSYGTAGTGTLVSGGAAGDKVCLLGRDATHYLTVSFTGTWVAN